MKWSETGELHQYISKGSMLKNPTRIYTVRIVEDTLLITPALF